MKRHRLWGPTWFVITAAGVLVSLVGGSIAIAAAINATAHGDPTARQTVSATATALPLLRSGYSPVRKEWKDPIYPQIPTLNSLGNFIDYGSEFSFTRVRVKDDRDSGDYEPTIDSRPGDEIEVELLVSNDAAQNMYTHSDVTIYDTQVAGTTESGSNGALITGWVRGSNAGEVSFGALLTSERPLRLTYERGSATFTNSSGDHPLSDRIGKGHWEQVGSDDLNGELKVGKNPKSKKNYDVGWLTLTYYVEDANR